MRVADSTPSAGFTRHAGFAVPLFSLRGSHDAGTGEILDLIPLVDWAARWHHHVIQLLPLNEAAPTEASPYSAMSAFAIDPSYVAATRVPDVIRSAAAQEWLRTGPIQARLRRLRQSRCRLRKESYGFKVRLLEFGFATFEADATAERRTRFDVFCRRNAWWLDAFALFRAIKERRKFASWETWPADHQERVPETLTGLRDALRHRVRFAQYLQWLAAEQWAQVREHARARGVRLKGDLPFVCSRDSADVWAHTDLFDLTSSAGAPPDAFSATGQAWGLPLYDWAAMRDSDYGWWRQRARQARELYDLFRIDHVVGMYRTYAIPVTDGGTRGFVPQHEPDQWEQGHTLMGALVAEAHPAAVVAEDLGTVPTWVRESLTQLGIPGYKVFRWEQVDGRFVDPRDYPALSIATTGTHDTDALGVWWTELTVHEQRDLLRALDLPAQSTKWPAPHPGLLQRLYEAGSVLTILPIQDLFGWTDRINVPATVGNSNWAWRLPVRVEDLDDQPALRERMLWLRDLAKSTGR